MNDFLCRHGVSVLLVCQQCNPGGLGVNLSDLRDGRQPAMSQLPDGRQPFISMLPSPSPQWVVGQADPGPLRMSLLEFQQSDNPAAQQDMVRQATAEIAKWTRVVALLEEIDLCVGICCGPYLLPHREARQDAIHLIQERITFFQQVLASTREQQAGIRFLMASVAAIARASFVPPAPEGEPNV